MLSELCSLNLKLYSKQNNKHFVLHLIVVPQLSSGCQHSYSTKPRQAGCTDDQSMYSLMPLIDTHYQCNNTFFFANDKEAKYAGVFIRNSPFQSGLIFERKAGSLHNRGVPESCPTQPSPRRGCKYCNRRRLANANYLF